MFWLCVLETKQMSSQHPETLTNFVRASGVGSHKLSQRHQSNTKAQIKHIYYPFAYLQCYTKSVGLFYLFASTCTKKGRFNL